MRTSPGTVLLDLLDLLLPGRCAGCSAALPLDRAGAPLCPGCASRLREPPFPRCPRCDAPRGTGREQAEDCLHCRGWPPILTRARAAALLEPPCDGLVHALKYGGRREAAAWMGRRMASGRRAVGAWGQAVTWVPTTPGRRRRRGYDQAELLAREVAAALGIPVLRLLARTREGPSQVSLPPEMRRSNVEQAFSTLAGAPALPERARIVLVDDVLTTGATVAAAASALERAGASGVTVLTFARSIPDRTRTA